MPPLRVALIGQQPFGVDVFKRLRDPALAEKIVLVGVSAPAPPTGKPGEPLWNAASDCVKSLGEGDLPLSLIDTGALSKEEAAQTAWRELQVDVAVLAFVTHLLPQDVIAACKYGAIQYHPSLLPLHRGRSAIAWAIINQEAVTGISIFWLDKFVDHGPLLKTVEVPIGPDDTVKSLYFGKLYPLGVDAIVDGLMEVVDAVTAGKEPPRIVQQHKVATYEPPLTPDLTRIVWHAPAETVYALIRGADPSPGAWTYFQPPKPADGGDAPAATKVAIFDCKLLRGADDLVAKWTGTVLDAGEDGFKVRLNGGAVLHVTRVMPEGGKKILASEWVASCGLAAGYRFKY